ncbi:MAG: XrtA/PEP-CTERM system TPR-repeat protein PrsT [Betaproteobacteria bacterium]
MKNSLVRLCGFSLSAALLLGLPACGSNDAASYVASAKSYMAKADYKAATIQLKNAIDKSPNDAEARFLLAKALFDSRDPVGAETEVRKALDLKYSPAEAYPLLAQALLAQGKSEPVVRELGAIKLDTTQGRTDLGTSLAVANAALGDGKQAMAAIDAVLREAPTDPRALVVKAQFAVRDGNVPEAQALLEKALAVSPDDQDALFAKSQIQTARGDRAGAVKTLEKAVAAHPESRPAQLSLISLLVSSKDLPAAQVQLDKLKATAPNEIGTVYAEALVAMAKGETAKAKELIQKVLAAAPDHLQALYLSALVDAQLNSFSSAEESLRKVIARMPEDVGVRKVLATTYLRNGQPGAAIETLEPVLRRSGDDAEILRLVAESYLASGNIARGAEFYERANGIDKTSVAGKVRLAQVRLAAGETDRGLKDLESLSKSNAEQYQSDLALVMAHVQRREYDKALAAIAALEKKQPDNPLVRNLRGSVYLAMRDFKRARTSFEQALSAKANDTTAALNLAIIDVQEGKADDARKRYEAMLAKDPNNEELLLSLAQLTALTRDNPEESKAIIDKAIAAKPSSVRARLALIGYYTRLRDTRAALAAAQAAQTAFPDDMLVLEALGSAQLAASEPNQAVATFARIVQRQPGAPAALIRLAAVQFATKDYAGSIDSARKALALQPDLPQAWGILTRAQIESGQSAAALADARKLQKEHSDRALGFAIEGEMLAADKKWTEAAAAIAEALKRQPLPILAASLYVSLENAGKPAEAKAFADRWRRDHPTDTAIGEVIAQQAMARKEYPTAIAQYRTILDTNPENAVALNNLAWLLSEAGDPKAREYAERAYRLAPFNASVVDTLGWTLFKTGDTARGTQLLRLASNLGPNEVEIRLHFAQALLKGGDKEGAKRALAPLIAMPAGSPARVEAEKLLGGN